jgi:tetratricopeptide (TPR) repeat protein
LAITPDGRYLISGSLDHKLKVWDLHNWQEITSFSADNPIYACAVTPDGSTVVIGDETGGVFFLKIEGAAYIAPTKKLGLYPNTANPSSPEKSLSSVSMNTNSKTSISEEVKILAQYYNQTGIKYGRKGNHNKALDYFDLAIQLDPNFIHSYNNRGFTYSKMQRYKEALKDLNRIIQLDPENVQAYSYRGFIYNNLQQYKKAMADFNHAIHLDDNCATAHLNKGVLLANLGGLYEASLHSEKASRLGLKEGKRNAKKFKKQLRQQLKK